MSDQKQCVFQRSSLVALYAKGLAAVNKRTGMGLGYGDNPSKRLGDALDASRQTMVFIQRMALRCPERDVIAADRVGMPQRSFDVLLSFYPKPREVELAKSNSKLAQQISIRQKQVRLFISAFGQHGLRGRRFRDAVSLWKRQNIDLWAEGVARKVAFDCEKNLKRRLHGYRADIGRMRVLLASGGDDSVRTRQGMDAADEACKALIRLGEALA